MTYRNCMIEVTQEAINSNRHCQNNCPIHDAIKKYVKPSIYVLVNADTIQFLGCNEEVGMYIIAEIATPIDISYWIFDYDHRIKVKPGHFEIRLPECVLKD